MRDHSFEGSCEPACDAEPDSAHPKYVTPQFVKPQYVRTTLPSTDAAKAEHLQHLLQYLIEKAVSAGDVNKPKTVDVGLPPGLQKPVVGATGCASKTRLGASVDQSPGLGSRRDYLFDPPDKWGNQAYWLDSLQGDANRLHPSWMGPSIQSPRPMLQSVECQDPVQERTFSNNRPALGRWAKRKCGPLNIATQLVALEGEDDDTVIVLRKIHKLGFDSADVLTRHYSAFGSVAKVLLSSTNEKLQRGMRSRPAGIGFVVFERSEDALAALAAGECQTVAGISIVVRPFAKAASTKDHGLDVDNSEK